MQKNVSAKTGKMVQLAILAAIVVLMAFTPLGYLQIGVVKITFLMIPVVSGAIILGPGAGAVLGAVFGMTSFVQCFGLDGFGTTLMGIQPVYTFIMCMFPRILMGTLCGVIFKGLVRVEKTRHKVIAYPVTGLCGALLNTVFFVGLLMLFFGGSDYIMGMRGDLDWFAFVVAFVGLNGVIEAVVCVVVAAAVSKALDVVMKRQLMAE